ncbi:hypothetical protein COOONC_04146 [Cooperia oncophora]
MSTTVKLLEIEDTTPNSQYGIGLRSTANAFVEALKVFDDAKRADRKDWKEKAEHKGDKCFNKHFPIGKVYYLKKSFNADAETVFRSHWNDVRQNFAKLSEQLFMISFIFLRSLLCVQWGCSY